jgi:hypothetical protein
MDIALAASMSSQAPAALAGLLLRRGARRPPSILFIAVSEIDNFDSAASIVFSRAEYIALRIR